VVTHQLQVERRTGKVRQSDTDVLPLYYATNLGHLGSHKTLNSYTEKGEKQRHQSFTAFSQYSHIPHSVRQIKLTYVSF